MDTQKTEDQTLSSTKISKELLRQSADLKKRSAELKIEMEKTAEACQQILHPEQDRPDTDTPV